MSTSNFLEILTVPMAAGEVRNFMVSGAYFEVIDATSPIDVRLTDKFGAVRGAMRNAEASFYLRASEFDVIEITSNAAQVIRIAYGTAEAGTRRTAGIVTVSGSIQTINLSEQRSNSSQLFRSVNTVTAALGNFSAAQIFNPAGSGKIVTLYEAELITAQTGFVQLRSMNAILPGTVQNGVNCRLGGPVSTAEIRYSNTNSAFTSELIRNHQMISNVSQYHKFEEIITIPPGFGIVAFLNQFNVSATINLLFAET